MFNKSLIFSTYKILLFFCALQAFKCSFFWNVNDVLSSVILAGISFLVMLTYKIIFSKENVAWFCIFISSLILATLTKDMNIFGWLSFFVYSFGIFILFNLPEDKKHDLYQFFRYGFALLIGVSLIGWCLFLIGIPLPHYYTNYGSGVSGDFQYNYENYYFFLLTYTGLDLFIIPRFCSFFLEPGYLGCLMTILLLSDHFQFGKGHHLNFIFLIALFFSFSLAGWMLALVTFMFDKFSTKQNHFIPLIVYILLFTAGFAFFKNYNNGDNIINETILSRLEYDSEKNNIEGYNRSTESLDDYFWNDFIFSKDVFFGNKNLVEQTSTSFENEVSIYAYAMNYGVVSLLFLIIYFFYPSLHTKTHRLKYFCLGFLLFLIFAQTAHMSHNLMYTSLFIIAIGKLNFQNKVISISNK